MDTEVISLVQVHHFQSLVPSKVLWDTCPQRKQLYQVHAGHHLREHPRGTESISCRSLSTNELRAGQTLTHTLPWATWVYCDSSHDTLHPSDGQLDHEWGFHSCLASGLGGGQARGLAKQVLSSWMTQLVSVSWETALEHARGQQLGGLEEVIDTKTEVNGERREAKSKVELAK